MESSELKNVLTKKKRKKKENKQKQITTNRKQLDRKNS